MNGRSALPLRSRCVTGAARRAFTLRRLAASGPGVQAITRRQLTYVSTPFDFVDVAGPPRVAPPLAPRIADVSVAVSGRPSDAPFYLVPYLEPGRKRRRRSLSAVRILWLVVCVLALALAVQVLLR